MRPVFKWTGIVLASLVGLLLLVLVGVYGLSERRLRKTYEVDPGAIVFRSDPQTLARGRHIAETRGCTDCHGENLAGKVFIDAPPMARLFASNLTRGEGGIGAIYTDRDWARSIRHGIGPDRRPLLFMPAHEFNAMSDEDLGAMITYFKSLPPVDNVLPENSVGPLGRVLYLSGQFPLVPAELIDHQAARRPAPLAGPTPEYGAYLATGCIGCHGPGFSGGKIPGGPPGVPAAANLTIHQTGLAKWTEQDFFRALREGKRPDGTELNEFMPWRTTARMTDEEIHAVWAFLNTLPAKPDGGR